MGPWEKSGGIRPSLCSATWLALGVLAVLGATANGAEAAPAYPKAVLLVSGFETKTPFSTPDPTCRGKEARSGTSPAASRKP